MYSYFHKIQYYETDKMGIVHHSNYFRWMEEARLEWMQSIGFGYCALKTPALFLRLFVFPALTTMHLLLERPPISIYFWKDIVELK